MCTAFFTPLRALLTPLLQAIIGPGIFFPQFLLMAAISKKISKISTHPTFDL